MKGKRLICLLAFATLSIAVEKRKISHNNGGIKIINTDSDDSELMQLEASGSKNKQRDNKLEQEKVKTLSQQVADGKYGLIQKELFGKPPKRPGIISYATNPEVPNDTISNLGGLDKNEIWLAENHLLVLKGGGFPPHEDKNEHTESIWPPLDTYKAPLHQVKIPPKPKVPPPFPVRLTENGPLQILGTNFSRTINETDQPPAYALPPPEGFAPSKETATGDTNSPDSPPRATPLPISVINPGEFLPGVSFPPSNLNETWPPFLGYLPPGAVILPPPGNQTDLYDDDDPSIYYPPPYSFFYPKDNSSVVPPGPLVPGIILPPPPDFFALLDETAAPHPKNNAINVPFQRGRKPTTIKSAAFPIYTTTPLPGKPTNVNGVVVTEKPIKVYRVKPEFANNNETRPMKMTTEKPKIITILPVQNRTYLPTRANRPHFVRKNPQNITILRPVKQKSTPPPKIYLTQNEIPEKPIESWKNKNPIVSTTQVPLKYYTTSNNVDSYLINEVKEHPQPNVHKTTVKPANYYYYEESDSKTTPKVPVQQNNYYAGEGFYIPPRQNPPAVRQRKPQYIYVTTKPYNTQKPRFRFVQQPVKTNTFSIHIAKLQNEIGHYYTVRTTQKPNPKPVYQYSFQAANYQSQNGFRPSIPDDNQQEEFKPIAPPPPPPPQQPPPKYSVQIQPAIEIFPTQPPSHVYYQNTYKRPQNYYTTPAPAYYHHRPITTARPIVENSFEVTPNPVYQGFYTKPDEIFVDENTREYFTVFGKKLPAGTTPLPGFGLAVTESYTSPSEQTAVYQNQVKYRQKPISLGSDTIVNYVNPRPNVSPIAERVPIPTADSDRTYPKVVKYSSRPPQFAPPKKINPQEPEIIKAIEVPVSAKETEDGSYISYELPGDDGAHFYFLTPQLAQRRQQGAGFYYSQPNIKRKRRDDIKSDKES